MTNYSKRKFPTKAIFIRNPNKIYTILDFDDGEEVTYKSKSEDNQTNKLGYRWYTNGQDDKLVHFTELHSAT